MNQNWSLVKSALKNLSASNALKPGKRVFAKQKTRKNKEKIENGANQPSEPEDEIEEASPTYLSIKKGPQGGTTKSGRDNMTTDPRKDGSEHSEAGTEDDTVETPRSSSARSEASSKEVDEAKETATNTSTTVKPAYLTFGMDGSDTEEEDNKPKTSKPKKAKAKRQSTGKKRSQKKNSRHKRLSRKTKAPKRDSLEEEIAYICGALGMDIHKGCCLRHPTEGITHLCQRYERVSQCPACTSEYGGYPNQDEERQSLLDSILKQVRQMQANTDDWRERTNGQKWQAGASTDSKSPVKTDDLYFDMKKEDVLAEVDWLSEVAVRIIHVRNWKDASKTPLGNHPDYARYFRLLRLGVPLDAIKLTVDKDGFDSAVLDFSPDLSLEVQRREQDVQLQSISSVKQEEVYSIRSSQSSNLGEDAYLPDRDLEAVRDVVEKLQMAFNSMCSKELLLSKALAKGKKKHEKKRKDTTKVFRRNKESIVMETKENEQEIQVPVRSGSEMDPSNNTIKEADEKDLVIQKLKEELKARDLEIESLHEKMHEMQKQQSVRDDSSHGSFEVATQDFILHSQQKEEEKFETTLSQGPETERICSGAAVPDRIIMESAFGRKPEDETLDSLETREMGELQQNQDLRDDGGGNPSVSNRKDREKLSPKCNGGMDAGTIVGGQFSHEIDKQGNGLMHNSELNLSVRVITSEAPESSSEISSFGDEKPNDVLGNESAALSRIEDDMGKADTTVDSGELSSSSSSVTGTEEQKIEMKNDDASDLFSSMSIDGESAPKTTAQASSSPLFDGTPSEESSSESSSFVSFVSSTSVESASEGPRNSENQMIKNSDLTSAVFVARCREEGEESSSSFLDDNTETRVEKIEEIFSEKSNVEICSNDLGELLYDMQSEHSLPSSKASVVNIDASETEGTRPETEEGPKESSLEKYETADAKENHDNEPKEKLTDLSENTDTSIVGGGSDGSNREISTEDISSDNDSTAIAPSLVEHGDNDDAVNDTDFYEGDASQSNPSIVSSTSSSAAGSSKILSPLPAGDIEDDEMKIVADTNNDDILTKPVPIKDLDRREIVCLDPVSRNDMLESEPTVVEPFSSNISPTQSTEDPFVGNDVSPNKNGENEIVEDRLHGSELDIVDRNQESCLTVSPLSSAMGEKLDMSMTETKEKEEALSHRTNMDFEASSVDFEAKFQANMLLSSVDSDDEDDELLMAAALFAREEVTETLPGRHQLGDESDGDSSYESDSSNFDSLSSEEDEEGEDDGNSFSDGSGSFSSYASYDDEGSD